MFLPKHSRRAACDKLGLPPPGGLVLAIHPSWSSWLALDHQTKRLINIDHDTHASFVIDEYQLTITWDQYGIEHFLKVEDFTFLPRMIKQLSLDELKLFYRKKARDLGMKSVV